MKTQEEIVRKHAVGPISIYKVYQEGYNDREEDYWATFRREAAKDVLPAVLARKSSICTYGEVVREAITFADELIKQLREEQK